MRAASAAANELVDIVKAARDSAIGCYGAVIAAHAIGCADTTQDNVTSAVVGEVKSIFASIAVH